ncbi:MAG: hypothetical protein ACP5XB_16700 [Isosphaeraceae bacterium]
MTHEAELPQLRAEFQALLQINGILDLLLVGKTPFGNQTRHSPIQGGLIAVQSNGLGEEFLREPSKRGMESKGVNRQGRRQGDPNPGSGLLQSGLIVIVELEPSVELFFDPVGTVSKLARHKLRHNQVDRCRTSGR